MKLKNDPIFLIALTCLCLPIGLILLIKAEIKLSLKIIIGLLGLIIFILLLVPAILTIDSTPSALEFDLVATRKELSVGESGGFSVTVNEYYITDFTATCDNESVLSIQNNTYTAKSPGECKIDVQYQNTKKSIVIYVNTEPATDKVVYASPTGERYHKTAAHAGKSSVNLTEEEALRSGKSPCKICWN